MLALSFFFYALLFHLGYSIIFCTFYVASKNILQFKFHCKQAHKTSKFTCRLIIMSALLQNPFYSQDMNIRKRALRTFLFVFLFVNKSSDGKMNSGSTPLHPQCREKGAVPAAFSSIECTNSGLLRETVLFLSSVNPLMEVYRERFFPPVSCPCCKFYINPGPYLVCIYCRNDNG